MRDLFAAAGDTDIKTDDANLGQDPKMALTKNKHYWQRVEGEIALEDTLPWHFTTGDCYHIFSYGTVSSISFLRAILKQQPLEYLSISSLSMGPTDIKILKKWCDANLIGRIDIYAHQFVGAQQMSCYVDTFGLAKNRGGEWQHYETTAK